MKVVYANVYLDFRKTDFKNYSIVNCQFLVTWWLNGSKNEILITILDNSIEEEGKYVKLISLDSNKIKWYS